MRGQQQEESRSQSVASVRGARLGGKRAVGASGEGRQEESKPVRSARRRERQAVGEPAIGEDQGLLPG
jgi:hypothetical protein